MSDPALTVSKSHPNYWKVMYNSLSNEKTYWKSKAVEHYDTITKLKTQLKAEKQAVALLQKHPVLLKLRELIAIGVDEKTYWKSKAVELQATIEELRDAPIKINVKLNDVWITFDAGGGRQAMVCLNNIVTEMRNGGITKGICLDAIRAALTEKT